MTAESPVLAVERRLHAAEHGAEPLPAPTASATARALTEALGEGLDDHVAAVRAYAEQREGASLADDGAALTLVLSDGEVLMELDEEQRIARLAFSMTAADLPSRGFWSRLFGRG